MVPTDSGAKIMAKKTLYLVQAENWVEQPIVHWETDQSNVHQENVVLTASVADASSPPISAPSRGQTATTLVVRMDHRVAMQLLGQLTVLGRSMGWLPEAKG